VTARITVLLAVLVGLPSLRAFGEPPIAWASQGRAAIARAEGAPPPAQSAPTPAARIIQTVTVPEVPKRSVVIIQLKGKFGEPGNGIRQEEPIITGENLDGLLERLSKRDPTAIVLDVGELSGGDDRDLLSMLETLVRLQRNGTRIVAWPQQAIGPGAAIALACREIIVRRGCVIAWNSDGAPPPPELADEIEQLTSRSSAVEAATRETASELWWSRSCREFAARPGDASDWEQVDGPKSRQRLDAPFLQERKLSKAKADKADALPEALTKSGTEPVLENCPIVIVRLPNSSELASIESVRRANALADGRSTERLGRFIEKLKQFETVLGIEHGNIGKLRQQQPHEIDQTDDDLAHQAFNRWTSQVAGCLNRILSNFPPTQGAPPLEVAPDAWRNMQTRLSDWKREFTACKTAIYKTDYFKNEWAESLQKGIAACRDEVRQMGSVTAGMKR
jgi:hypothetical protein